MIPADLATRLRLVTQDLPSPVQPAVPARQLPDVLSELSAGQRIMAEIQALLPNGMYRAVVAQREITLALPFSAKPGDSLELEVVDNDGQLTLALATGKHSGQAEASESVPTTLSKTGSFIGNLLSEIDHQGGKAKPAPLNANQPLLDSFPEKTSDLAPILKEALTKSGMFYEAHQARWIEGKLATANLLQEPQGKLSPNLLNHDSGIQQHPLPQAQPQSPLPHEQPLARPQGSVIADDSPKNALPNDAVKPQSVETSFQRSVTDVAGTAIHPETTPLVQQQLNALATQTYAWQGQIWPGQEMQWEIAEDEQHGKSSENGDGEHHWKTRLRLDLPHLGNLDAKMSIDTRNQLQISISTGSEESRKQLLLAIGQFDNALQAVGLALSGFSITHDEPTNRENP